MNPHTLFLLIVLCLSSVQTSLACSSLSSPRPTNLNIIRPAPQDTQTGRHANTRKQPHAHICTHAHGTRSLGTRTHVYTRNKLKTDASNVVVSPAIDRDAFNAAGYAGAHDAARKASPCLRYPPKAGSLRQENGKAIMRTR